MSSYFTNPDKPTVDTSGTPPKKKKKKHLFAFSMYIYNVYLFLHILGPLFWLFLLFSEVYVCIYIYYYYI